MSSSMTGIVAIVQEGRFQLTDDGGVSHFFVLSARAGAETEQLAGLRRSQTRVRVRYQPAANLIGNIAIAIYAAG